MEWSIHLMTVLATCTAYPTSDTSYVTFNSNERTLEELTNELHDAVYRQNFKNALGQYVRTEYKHLTFKEQEKVNDIIEELLQNLARDITISLDGEDGETGEFSTRTRGDTVEELHKRVVSAVPNVERYALHVAYRLENEILKARQRIDDVIKDSRLAYVQNS